MRVVYLGTTEFASAVLERLAGSPHEVAAVITRPDRARGRGRKVQSPPVADAARALDLPLLQPAAVNDQDSVEAIGAFAPDAVVVCAFGALIGDPLLALAEPYNVHPSLLPRWRGAAPVERAIQAGDDQTGVCIMQPVAELDAGPVYLQANEPIAPDDDYGSLAPRLATLGGDLLVRALDERPAPTPQPSDGVTYAEKITAEDRRLDPSEPAVALERTVRALTPHIGAWVDAGEGERLGVEAARALPDPAPEGLSDDGDRLLLGTAGGALELLRVKPSGGRSMAAADYLRGRVRRGRHTEEQ